MRRSEPPPNDAGTPPSTRPSVEQVSHAFRALADRHAEERSRVSKERNWRRLSRKWQARHKAHSAWANAAYQTLLRISVALRWAFGDPAGKGSLRWATVGVLGLSATFGLGLWLAPTPLSYQVRGASGEQLPTLEDGWLRTQGAGATVDFTDGTEIELSAHSALRVELSGEHGAVSHLAQGRLSANVHHADKSKWTFAAGPFQVHVLGTRFDLAWQQSEFSLNLHQGRVRVVGPSRTWLLNAGDSLRMGSDEVANDETHDGGRSKAAAPSAGVTADDNPAAQERGGDSKAEVATAARSVLAVQEHAPQSLSPSRQTSARASGGLGWPKLLSKGRFDEVLSDARERRLVNAPHTLSESDLVALAQAAGYSGDGELAAKCWRQVRKQFSRSGSASRGAFYLARLAEQRGELREALSWLDVYAREAPNGALGAEAAGRRLTLLRRLEGANSRAATAAAEDYLKRFPTGAYADTARGTLGRK